MHFCSISTIQNMLIVLVCLLIIRNVYHLFLILVNAFAIIQKYFKSSGQNWKKILRYSLNLNKIQFQLNLIQENDKLETNIRFKLWGLEKSFIFRLRSFDSRVFVKCNVYPVHKGSLDTYFKSVEHENIRPTDSMNNACMQFEWLRLQSFSNFPQTVPQRPIRLAQAGFFYTDVEDRVQCFSCGVQHSGWRSGDNAIMIHQRISPECRYVHGGDRNNVPIRYLEEYVESVDPASAQTVGTSEHAPVTPAPHQNTRNENVGHPLHSESQDNIVNTPNLNSSNQRNSQVSSNASELNEASARSGAGVIHQQNKNGDKSSPFRFDSIGIFFGKPRYPAYAVLSVRLSSFQDWPSHLTQTPRDMASAGFLYAGYSDYVRCFFCGGGLRNWEENDDPWTEHAHWFPRCEFLRQNKGDDFVLFIQETKEREETSIGQRVHRITDDTDMQTAEGTSLPAFESVLEMGYSREIIQQAYSILIHHEEVTRISAEDLLDQIFTLEDVTLASVPDVSQEQPGSGPMAVAGITPTVHNGGSKEQVQNDSDKDLIESVKSMALNADTQSLRKENEMLKEKWRCKICMDLEACMAFLPCGHLCCCVECAPAMRKCPICRRFIKGTVKTYPT